MREQEVSALQLFLVAGDNQASEESKKVEV